MKRKPVAFLIQGTSLELHQVHLEVSKDKENLMYLKTLVFSKPDPRWLWTWTLIFEHLPLRANSCNAVSFCNYRVHHFASASSRTRRLSCSQCSTFWTDLEPSALISSPVHLTQEHKPKMLNLSAGNQLRSSMASSKTDGPNPSGFVLTSKEPLGYSSIVLPQVWGHGPSKPALDQRCFIWSLLRLSQ